MAFLELRFRAPSPGLPAYAVVVLNTHSMDAETGLARATTMCASMTELEGQLWQLERQIAEIREKARSCFAEAGVPY
jgi:hypothetical protein